MQKHNFSGAMSLKLKGLDAKIYNQLRIIAQAQEEMRQHYLKVMHDHNARDIQAAINQTFIYLESVEDSLSYAREMLEATMQHKIRMSAIKRRKA